MPTPSDVALRTQIIRLAHNHPEFRGDLLPILTASHDVEAGTYQDYLEKKKKQGKPPMKKDEWEARTNGGQQGGSTPPKKKDAPKEEEKKDEGKAKKEEPKSEKKDAPAKDEPKKSYKKTYKPAVTKVMDKHSLTDDDAAQVKAFKSDKPPTGAPVSPAVLMQRFMAKAKPETKERMKGMSPKEFMAMLAAISDDEGGKTATLRANLIRLAHSNPEFRKDLLPLIQACDHAEGPMMGKYEEGKPADPTENMSEEDKKNWELNTLKHKDKFKAAEDESEDDGDDVAKEAALRSSLIRLAHSNPALRKDILPLLAKRAEDEKEPEEKSEKEASAKTAATATIRKNIAIIVRIRSQKAMPVKEGLAPFIQVTGQMSIDFGGDVQPDAVVFTSTISDTPKGFIVHSFDMVKTVSGGGAEILLGVLKSAFHEALTLKGRQLLTVSVPEPIL